MRWMNSPIHPLHHKECVCVCTVCVLVSSLLGSDSGQWPQWRSEDREVWSLLAQFTSQSNDGNDLFFVWFCWLFVMFVFRTIWILSFIWCCWTPVTLLKAKSLTIVAWTLWFVLFSQAVGCVGNVRSHYSFFFGTLQYVLSPIHFRNVWQRRRSWEGDVWLYTVCSVLLSIHRLNWLHKT